MSAEKEIVNFWYNKNGFFTINNIKTGSNKDAGILALKFGKDGFNEVLHIGVACSITNNIAETSDLQKPISMIIDEKFHDRAIAETIGNLTEQFPLQKREIKRVIVLGAVSRPKKGEIAEKFRQKGVEVIEFEDILYDVIEKMDTRYYRNDIIRTLQLAKFLLLNDPAKLAKLPANAAFSSHSRKEFLSSILDKEEIMREFKKTNAERLAAILKNANLKPDELARMLEHNVLNRRTRRMFLDSLNEQEKIRRVVGRIIKKRKSEESLEKFF